MPDGFLLGDGVPFPIFPPRGDARAVEAPPRHEAPVPAAAEDPPDRAPSGRPSPSGVPPDPVMPPPC